MIGLLALVVTASAIGTAHDETRLICFAERRLDRVFDGSARSDVFVVRHGHKPILVAGRGDGRTWNVYPAFSPDGTKLAFATTSSARLSISVVRMTPTGPSAAQS
jgi:WD40-like Beta Propeller Repeat